MNKQELIEEILNDMEWKEEIRSGIWTHKTNTYQEFFNHCHDYMLPDDFRYKMIHDILEEMNGYEDHEDYVYEILENIVPVYTHDLMAWLSSSNSRYSYADDAVSEYGHGESIINDISMGYLFELQEVYALINEWLDDNCEE